MTAPERPIPRATYRLQLHRDFGFKAVTALATYFGSLGISHAYLSPILKARPGSTHGYDTVDHTQINPELGTLGEFRDMAHALRAAGVGILLDIVPNHMGIGGAENPLWLDVLEWGAESRYANWFDIDWQSPTPALAGKVLVPFLDRALREALADGQLRLKFDAAEGSFSIWIADHHRLPVTPSSYGLILGGIIGRLARPMPLAVTGEGDAGRLKQTLREAVAANPDFTSALDAQLAGINADPEILARLIELQHWRAARFDTADDAINYRRFFTISDLAGIRIEEPAVFDHVHALTFALIEDGLVDGLRVDHVDGLYDPKTYCLMLREKSPRPIYIIVEKILAAGETLPADWHVDGTTGYEFGALVNPLLVDPDGEAPLTKLQQEVSGSTQTAPEIERAAKCRVMDHELAAELDALARRLSRLALETSPRGDLTRQALQRALRAFAADLPVYRLYRSAAGISETDRKTARSTIAISRRRCPEIPAPAFDFLETILVGPTPPAKELAAALELVQRIQQFTGPVMAKGLEDTALYRYNRLLALNDVGVRPGRFSSTVGEFHAAMTAQAAHFPHTLIGTSSHDSKRGEDTRARLIALSGRPDEWRKILNDWNNLTQQLMLGIHPDDASHLLQLLVGAWPTELPLQSSPDLTNFANRLVAAMMKSLREARLRSFWTRPNQTQEGQIERFIHSILAPENAALFAPIARFCTDIGWDGARNGLIETALKLTVPGVPDIYQGAELWEQSLVDPDNRRPVDFGRRAQLLMDDPAAGPEALLDRWQDGAVKQRLIAKLLHHRRLHPDLFANGTYQPITAANDRTCAFRRDWHGESLLVGVRLYPWREAAPSWNDLDIPDPEIWNDVLADAQWSARPAGPGRLPILVLSSAR